jgi:predicted aspartyl protease
VGNIIGAGVAVVVLLLAFSGPLAAGPLEDGLAAHRRGDYALALRHWWPLADQGNAVAQNYLGVMYAQGRGVPQDFAVAASWYRKAADQAYGVAEHNLGFLYQDGRGVPQDYVTAHMWFNLAAAGGYKDAASARDTVAAKMTQAQIVEAQQLAQNLSKNRALSALLFGSQPSFAPAAKGALIPLQLYGGVFTVPVSINDKLTLNFMLDSGAADVSIPADVVSTLWRTGTLGPGDFLGKKTYVLADGSTVPSQTFRIKSLKLGEKTIVENVTGSISPAAGDPLLGQTFLRRFKSWSIDNQRQVLVLE